MLDFIFNIIVSIFYFIINTPKSLDLATAFSILGALWVYLRRSKHEERSDIRSEKWKMMKEMTDVILKYKSDIRRDVTRMLIKRNDALKGIMKERNKEEEEELDYNPEGIAGLISNILLILDEASYFAEYNIQQKAKIIARKYEPAKDDQRKSIKLRIKSWLPGKKIHQDQGMDIPRQIESFISEIEKANKRLSSSFEAFKVGVDDLKVFEWDIEVYFVWHFLMEVGMSTRGINVIEDPKIRYKSLVKGKKGKIKSMEKNIKSMEKDINEVERVITGQEALNLEMIKKIWNFQMKITNLQIEPFLKKGEELEIDKLEQAIKKTREVLEVNRGVLEKDKKKSSEQLLKEVKEMDQKYIKGLKEEGLIKALNEKDLDEYRPRIYYKENNSEDEPNFDWEYLPPTIFDVLDKFADSISEEIKKDHLKE